MYNTLHKPVIDHYIHSLEFCDKRTGRSLAIVFDCYSDSGGTGVLRNSQIQAFSSHLDEIGLGTPGRIELLARDFNFTSSSGDRFTRAVDADGGTLTGDSSSSEQSARLWERLILRRFGAREVFQPCVTLSNSNSRTVSRNDRGYVVASEMDPLVRLFECAILRRPPPVLGDHSIMRLKVGTPSRAGPRRFPITSMHHPQFQAHVNEIYNEYEDQCTSAWGRWDLLHLAGWEVAQHLSQDSFEPVGILAQFCMETAVAVLGLITRGPSGESRASWEKRIILFRAKNKELRTLARLQFAMDEGGRCCFLIPTVC
jgi:hypothetical protein